MGNTSCERNIRSPALCLKNNILKSFAYLQTILGNTVQRPAILDADLADELVGCCRENDNFKTIKGKTMCTMDFYEGNYMVQWLIYYPYLNDLPWEPNSWFAFTMMDLICQGIVQRMIISHHGTLAQRIAPSFYYNFFLEYHGEIPCVVRIFV